MRGCVHVLKDLINGLNERNIIFLHGKWSILIGVRKSQYILRHRCCGCFVIHLEMGEICDGLTDKIYYIKYILFLGLLKIIWPSHLSTISSDKVFQFTCGVFFSA